MASYVRGVINLRGRIIPVIDLRQRFGLGITEDTDVTCVIVVQVEGTERSVTVGVIAMHWAMRDNTFETAVMRLPPWAIAAIGSTMACAVILTQGNSNAFIYFQF
jgi:chemotaxis signal transduction protein